MKRGVPALNPGQKAIVAGICFGAAEVLTIFCAMRAQKIVDRKIQEVNQEKIDSIGVDEVIDEEELITDLPAKTKVAVCWKEFIIPASLTAAGFIFLFSSVKDSKKQIATLAALYGMSETAFHEYKEQTKLIAGEKKEAEIRSAVDKKMVESHPARENLIIPSRAGGDTLCYDATGNRYFRSDINTIKSAINNLNYRLRDEMRIPVNDYYRELDIPTIPLGDDIGWDIENGMLEPAFNTELAENDEPVLVVSFYVGPRYFEKSLY